MDQDEPRTGPFFGHRLRVPGPIRHQIFAAQAPSGARRSQNWMPAGLATITVIGHIDRWVINISGVTPTQWT